MIDEDQIIFNDLDDGWGFAPAYFSPCNNWDDFIFFVDYSEYGRAIVYDNPIADQRISLTIGDMDEHVQITINRGASIENSDPKSYKSEKQLKFVKHYSEFSLSDFLEKNRQYILPSSKDKFLRMTKGYLNLPAFL